MLCSGSGGTESKSWGSFRFSVLISSPYYRSSEAESSAGKVPCCPARLPKMQKRSSRRPSTSHHHISQTPHPVERSHNAAGSVLSSSRLCQQALFSFCPLSLPVQFLVHVINTCRSDDTVIQWLRVRLLRALSGMAQVGSAKVERRTQILSDHLKGPKWAQGREQGVVSGARVWESFRRRKQGELIIGWKSLVGIPNLIRSSGLSRGGWYFALERARGER
jgi:hypothetical protein